VVLEKFTNVPLSLRLSADTETCQMTFKISNPINRSNQKMNSFKWALWGACDSPVNSKEPTKINNPISHLIFHNGLDFFFLRNATYHFLS